MHTNNYLSSDYQNFIALSRYARWREGEQRREGWLETVQEILPSKEAVKYHSSTKNIIQINVQTFEEVPIHHTQTKHKTDII